MIQWKKYENAFLTEAAACMITLSVKGVCKMSKDLFVKT